MRLKLFGTSILLGMAVLLGNPLAQAQVMLTSNWDETESAPIGDSVMAGYHAESSSDYTNAYADYASDSSAAGNGYCDGCCDGGCCDSCGVAGCGRCRGGLLGSRCCYCAYADPCPRLSIVSFSGFEAWGGPVDRGLVDNALNNNFGFVGGTNIGVPLPKLEDYGLGWQFGYSGGIYDWGGRQTPANSAQDQQQYYITTGLFRHADTDRPLTFGLVYDWSINKNMGALAQSPFMGQFRGQVGYALSGCNEIGVWGAWHDRAATRDVDGVSVVYRSTNLVNAYWHHKFEQCGADGWLFIGSPLRGRPNGALGTLGDFMAGGATNVPINDRLAVYTTAMYMKPSAATGTDAGVSEQAWQLSAGIAWYPGRYAHTSTVAGQKWRPLLDVANNASFITDRVP